ncbi:MAG: hypothetical protein U5L09_04455 [Bacteroidales bacterium]|nr:hypothetical protein [Bacteroidales bacterium]
MKMFLDASDNKSDSIREGAINFVIVRFLKDPFRRFFFCLQARYWHLGGWRSQNLLGMGLPEGNNSGKPIHL